MTDAPAPPVAVRVEIEGRVQGVGFRYWTKGEARRRNLVGWVRNRIDGSVEALFAGPAATVAEMVEACRKGPPVARVTEVRTFAAEVPPGAGFEGLPTV